jgi:hypothetical protein
MHMLFMRHQSKSSDHLPPRFEIAISLWTKSNAHPSGARFARRSITTLPYIALVPTFCSVSRPFGSYVSSSGRPGTTAPIVTPADLDAFVRVDVGTPRLSRLVVNAPIVTMTKSHVVMLVTALYRVGDAVRRVVEGAFRFAGLAVGRAGLTPLTFSFTSHNRPSVPLARAPTTSP